MELVAIRYVAWLSPEFEIRVYETFREAVLNGTRVNLLEQLDPDMVALMEGKAA